MALDKFTEDVEVIQKLSTFPNADDGLTAEELKAKFDEGSTKIKVYLNDTLIPAIDKMQTQLDDSAEYPVAVTGNDTDGYTADNDVYDIMTADQEGLKCVCHWGAVQLPMVRLESELAVFSAVLDGMEYRVEFRPDNVAAVSEELSLRRLNIIDPDEFTELWFLNTAVGTATINDGWTSSVNNTHGVYPVEDGENVAFSSTVKVGIYLYDTDGVLRSYALHDPSPVVSCSVEGYTIGYLGIVAGAPAGGIVACRGYDENYLPAYLQLAQEGYVIQQREAHDYIAGKRLDALDKKIAGTAPGFTLNWYALGDSITEGIYGYVDESGTAANAKDATGCWAALAAKYNNWTLTNKGIGGTGYVSKGRSGALTNARELVDKTDFSDVDLVTLAYGVNDWMHNVSLGAFDDDIATGGTIYSNMRYCVEKILSTAPHVKIVVISPLNCAGQGDFSTNWGAGVAFSNSGTLEDIYAAQKEICTYYGIEFIDMLHSSVVNRLNIESVLPDKVHPSPECHVQLARELSRKIVGVSPGHSEPQYALIERIEVATEGVTGYSYTQAIKDFKLTVTIPAGAASATGGIEVYKDGSLVAYNYLGSIVNLSGRMIIVNSRNEYGESNVEIRTRDCAASTGYASVNGPLQSILYTNAKVPYSKILVYSASDFPIGTVFELKGLRC